LKTKLVNLKTGSRTILYKNETTGVWSSSKEKALDLFHSLILDSASPDEKRIRTIRRYYSETNEYNRTKIREMVNRDEKNIDLLYDTIINLILSKE
jgi:hypothetical protein